MLVLFQFCVLFLFPSWFHKKKEEKNKRKKERNFERSSCHFFFKESTFLERAPGGSHPSGGPILRGAHVSKRIIINQLVNIYFLVVKKSKK